MLVKVIFLIVFFAVMIGVGLYSRKHATNVNDFVLGGRSVGPWLTAFAYGTSYFSAVVFVGYAGQFGYKYGLASTWIGIGNALIGSLLAWVILGRRTRIMSNHLSAATMPDYFGKRYDSKALRIAASAIAFIFLIPYTASVYNGLSRLFGMAFDIPYEVCVIAMAVLTCAYVILGGYMATAINDFIQGIVMLVGIVAVIAAVLSGQGGFLDAVRSLSELESDVAVTMGQKGAFASFFGPDPLNLLGVIILTSLGTWGLPQMIHKFYAIKDEKSIQSGTIISTFFAVIVSGGCYFLGGFGRLFDTTAIRKEDGSVIYDAIIPEMLSTLPDILVGVVIVLVLSASMSTLSSLVLTSSSTFTLDVIKPAAKQGMSDKKQVSIMRVFIVFFILVSAVIAIFKDAHPEVTFIAQMMGVSWGALAGAFLAPFLYGLYWKGITKFSVVVCFVWGCGIALLQLFVTLGGVDVTGWGPILGYIFRSSINSGVIAMVGGLLLVPVISLFTKKQDEKELREIFSCYDETVTITKKSSLQE